jgi:hypothetical protein
MSTIVFVDVFWYLGAATEVAVMLLSFYTIGYFDHG